MEGDSARAQALAAWESEAAALDWARPWSRLCDERPAPDSRWFVDAQLNVAANCLDRHLETRGDQLALCWEGEPGDRRQLTYRELADEVDNFAAGLHALGVRRGDRVALYLGMVPETVVAMLACARIGAVHCVLFSALPPDALADRLEDMEPRVLVTQDGSWRHGVVLPLKARADEALAATSGVDHTVVVRRTGIDVSWYEGDRWYADIVETGRARPRPDELFEADDPLLVIYLANRRGQPTGIVHRAGGLAVYASALHRRALTIVPDDVMWCAVDIGWVAGQTHGVYGPLLAGATTVLFEGTLDTPTRDRAWQVIERYGVSTLVTTPSVARNLREWVDSPPSQARLDTLRSIVHGGEPIDDDTRMWLREEVGGGQAVVRDGWGQTELGAIVTVDPAPDPPLPDPGLAVVDDNGRPTAVGEPGELILRHPWPGMFLGVRHPDPRVTDPYWRRSGCYSTGDRARREPDGEITILGRMDPVVSVSGQRVSANEVRDVLEEHPLVAHAEVVARPDRRSGEAVVACVVLDETTEGRSAGHPLENIAGELRVHVEECLGGLARPRAVAFLEERPDDLSREALREALTLLCSARLEDQFLVTAAQVRAIAAASGHGIG